MRKMTTPILLALVLVSVSPGPVFSAPRSITTVNQEQLTALENMHQQATDLLLKNDFQSALRVYSDILLLEPDDETAYTGLGQIYMVLGQTKKAHEAFQNALAINPNNEVAAAGVQKIMDPDGVEGMTSRGELENNGPTPNFQPVSVALLIDPGHKAWAGSAEPLGPMRSRPKRSSAITRPGKLHAQRVQMALRNAGLYSGPVNGMVGDSTKAALKEFQRKSGLLVTGTMNSATWNALSSYLEKV